jgi:hypothetical protein
MGGDAITEMARQLVRKTSDASGSLTGTAAGARSKRCHHA